MRPTPPQLRERTPMSHRRHPAVLISIALSLGIAACGSSGSKPPASASTPPTTATAATTTSASTISHARKHPPSKPVKKHKASTPAKKHTASTHHHTRRQRAPQQQQPPPPTKTRRRRPAARPRTTPLRSRRCRAPSSRAQRAVCAQPSTPKITPPAWAGSGITRCWPQTPAATHLPARSTPSRVRQTGRGTRESTHSPTQQRAPR